MAQLTPLKVSHPIDVNGNLYGLLGYSIESGIVKVDPVTGNVSEPIKDANGKVLRSSAYSPSLMNINGTLVFIGDTDYSSTSRGLWKVDSSGKAILFESTKLSNADAPRRFNNITNVDGIIYFSGERWVEKGTYGKKDYSNELYGFELYKLDPATGEATFVEIEPGDKSSNPSNFISVNGTLYFTATTADSGTELWKLDADGKPQKLEIITGTNSSNPSDFTKFNNTLYFSVLSGSTGAGLYKVDTTTGNPVKVADTNVFEPAIINGGMYFRTGDQGYEIKKIDASDNITQVALGTLKTGGSSGGQLTSVNNNLYFLTNTVNSSGYFNGTALTKLDAGGNPVVFDKIPGIGSGAQVSHLTKIGNELYFVAQETDAGNAKIWKIDEASGNPVEIAPSPIKTNILRQSIGFESNGVVVFPMAGFLSKLDNNATATANNPPLVANAIADQSATIDTAFSFVVPTNSFSDPDAGNTLTYSATLADGTAIPTWLTFDPATKTFTGTPPAGTDNLNLRVKAADSDGFSITDDFSVAVSTPTPVPTVTTGGTTPEPVPAIDPTPTTGGNAPTPSIDPTLTTVSNPPETTPTVGSGTETPVIDPTLTTGSNPPAPTTTENGNSEPVIDPILTTTGGGTPPVLVADNNPIRGTAPNERGESGSSLIPGVALTTSNLFQTDSTFKGFGISAISQKPTQKVSEIALFAVDDISGKIGSLAPGQPGYLSAALGNAKSIFSTLGGDFFSTNKRELALDSSKIYQAVEVVGGSILDARQQLASGLTPNNLLFSLTDASGNSPIEITNTADGFNLSINKDQLVLAVNKLSGSTVNIPIGAKSQSAPEGRTIDLSDYVGQTLKADVVTKSSAAYSNQVGFYAVEDALGTIKSVNGDKFIPSDASYAVEAIKLALTNSLQAGKNDSWAGKDIGGGKIYAPVVVAQGTFDDFVTKNPTNGGGANNIHAYFNYIGANTDRVDHFRLLGDNTFGVEDMYGGGDRDFNDLVVSMNVKAPANV